MASWIPPALAERGCALLSRFQRPIAQEVLGVQEHHENRSCMEHDEAVPHPIDWESATQFRAPVWTATEKSVGRKDITVACQVLGVFDDGAFKTRLGKQETNIHEPEGLRLVLQRWASTKSSTGATTKCNRTRYQTTRSILSTKATNAQHHHTSRHWVSCTDVSVGA